MFELISYERNFPTAYKDVSGDMATGAYKISCNLFDAIRIFEGKVSSFYVPSCKAMMTESRFKRQQNRTHRLSELPIQIIVTSYRLHGRFFFLLAKGLKQMNFKRCLRAYSTEARFVRFQDIHHCDV